MFLQLYASRLLRCYNIENFQSFNFWLDKMLSKEFALRTNKSIKQKGDNNSKSYLQPKHVVFKIRKIKEKLNKM